MTIPIKLQNKIVELSLAGWKITDIAQYYKIDPCSVRKYRRKHNIPRYPTQVLAQEIIDDSNKITQTELADKYGFSRMTIYNVIRRVKDGKI